MADELRYDVESHDIVTNALRELLNAYPGLVLGEEITFSTLSSEGGIAMFPISGAVIQSENEDVTGHVIQTCLYPFSVIYRAAGLSENRKAKVKEWLDNLGRWLEKQNITLNGTEYELKEYPTLTGDREFLYIQRTSPSTLIETNTDKIEDWGITIQAQYRNEFEKK